MFDLPILNKNLARLMMVSFFLPMHVQVFSVGIACLYYLFQAFSPKNKINKSTILQAIALSSGFLLCLIAIPFTPTEYRNTILNICESKVSLLLIPVIFALIRKETLSTIRKEQIFFVYACIIACVLGNIRFIAHYYHIQGNLHNLTHVQYRQYLEFVTGIHPTYWGLYLSYAICILLTNDAVTGGTKQIIKYLMLYTLLLLLLASLAKSPIIAMVVISLHYAYMKRRQVIKSLVHVSVFALVLIAAYIFIPFFSQRVAELSGISSGVASTEVHSNSVNERKMIFNTDVALLKKTWLWGVGPGRLQEMLDKNYFFYSIRNQVNTAYYDPHNEYLWQWLSFGIIGIAINISVLLLHYYRAIKSKNILYLYLLIIFSITFFTESVLARQHGVLLYSIFTSLFFFTKSNKENYST